MEARIAQLEHQLKELTIGAKTKDLSLTASMKEWGGRPKAKQIEQCARLSNWSEDDAAQVVKAKLTKRREKQEIHCRN
jgi:hypothetical protein